MDKLKMHTPNRADENFKKLVELFPDAVTETIKGYDENGKPIIERAIDKDVLMQEISYTVVEGKEERYQFTWPDKRKAILSANAPIAKTLRPVRDDEVEPTGCDSSGKPYCSSGSVDFDNTENLYIEGDNLEVLKLLQETYLGKIKMIYIDPPYNTGKDFVYRDNFVMSSEEWKEESGNYDEDGNLLVDRMRANSESNGRFHTDWLNMIYPRLKLAKDLLSDDGVIFISIDDNEQENLRKICDEIFGASNFISNIVWKRKRGRDNSARWFSKAHEYCLIYAKIKDKFYVNYLELDEETKKAYKNPDNDPRGDYRMLGCWARGTQGGVKYDFTTKSGQYFSERLWLFSKENLIKLDNDDKLIIRGDNIYRKMFITENKGKIPETLWDDVSNAANASDEIKKLFDCIAFDTSKPIPYIKRMIEVSTNKDDYILDFFSGSATTAHAIMQLNAEDSLRGGGTGHRKFIMVQLPEVTDEKSEAHKAGYKNICEIGKERIRRAAKKIKEETDADIDYGFRVLKCDSTNMKDVYYNPSELQQSLLNPLCDNIKEDRTAEDLLFQVMLDLGILLSSHIKCEELSVKDESDNTKNYRYFSVENDYLIACFDDNITEEVIIEITKKKPYYFVMRDSSIANDSVATNFEQIFATYSPNTIRKVL